MSQLPSWFRRGSRYLDRGGQGLLGSEGVPVHGEGHFPRILKRFLNFRTRARSFCVRPTTDDSCNALSVEVRHAAQDRNVRIAKGGLRHSMKGDVKGHNFPRGSAAEVGSSLGIQPLLGFRRLVRAAPKSSVQVTRSGAGSAFAKRAISSCREAYVCAASEA